MVNAKRKEACFMLTAGETRCAVIPINGMTVLGYVSRNGKETVRSQTISQTLTRAQSIARGTVARDNLVAWRSL
jgi:hypothetical protein